MATITKIQNKDRSLSYRAQVRVKRGGRLVHAEARTFPDKKLAADWAARLEAQLREDGGIEKRKLKGITVAELLRRYTVAVDATMPLGATKRSVLKILQESSLADIGVQELTAAAVIKHCRERNALGAKPQTVMQDVIYLGVALGAASALLDLPVTRKAVDDALPQLWAVGLVRKSAERERRLMPGEFERLMVAGARREAGVHSFIPIREMIRFAIASAMRISEAVRLQVADVDRKHRTVLIRDRKDPKHKIGNHQVVPLLGEAWDIVAARLNAPAEGQTRIFPYHEDSVGNAFRQTALEAGIEDLTLHDMRHEGISRLFEQGYQIQEVALVSGHRDWKSLKRYTNLRARDLHRQPFDQDVLPPIPGRTDRR